MKRNVWRMGSRSWNGVAPTVAVVLALLVSLIPTGHAGAAQDKVAVCHFPPGQAGEVAAVGVDIHTGQMTYAQGEEVSATITVRADSDVKTALQVVVFDPTRTTAVEDIVFSTALPVNLRAAKTQDLPVRFTPAQPGAYHITAAAVAEPRTLHVAAPAVQAHLRHGDSLLEEGQSSCPARVGPQGFAAFGVRPPDAPPGIPETILRYETVGLDPATMRADLDAAAGQPVTLSLGSHEMTVTAPGSNPSGLFLAPAATPAALQGGRLFQGTLAADDGTPVAGSLVVLSVWGDALYGMLSWLANPADPTSPQETLWVEPLRDHVTTAAAGQHLVYLNSEVLPPPLHGDPAAHSHAASAAPAAPAESAASSSPALVDDVVFLGLFDVYEHFLSDEDTQRRLSLFNAWQAQFRSEFFRAPRRGETDNFPDRPVTVTGIFIEIWETLPADGYGDSCGTNLHLFTTVSRVGTADNPRFGLDVLFTDRGTDCGGVAWAGAQDFIRQQSLTVDTRSFSNNVVILAQEIGHNLDYHTDWSCSGVNCQTTDVWSGGERTVPEDPHLDVSEGWTPTGDFFFIQLSAAPRCTVMRASYGGCVIAETRYHRSEDRVLRHLSEGMFYYFIQD